MSAIITRSMIGATLMGMIVLVCFSLMVSFGNEYGVTLDDQYYGSFGTEQGLNGQLQSDNQLNDLAYDSAALQEGSDLDNSAFDTAQSPGSIAAEQKQLGVLKIAQSFADDLSLLGISYYTAITVAIITILSIGLVASAGYIYFKVIP